MSLNRTDRGIVAALVLSCASAVGATSQVPAPPPLVVDIASVSINTANGLRLYAGEPFTGVAEKRDGTGAVLESDRFVDGLRHGHSRIWFPDGTLAYETIFQRGLRQGLSRTWWSNGKLRSQTRFVADQAEGEVWAWYATGEPYKRHYYSGGVPVGLQQAWRRNGKLYENFEIRNGRSFGLRNANMCVEVKDSTT